MSRDMSRAFQRSAVASAALVLFLAACEHQDEATATAPRRPLNESAARMKAADIPDGPVKGELGGEPFEARDVRLHVVKVPGAERVDLIFADREIEHCGLPGQPTKDRGRRVWVRFRGTTTLLSGTTRIEPEDQGDIEAHYEQWVTDHWIGFGRSATLLEIESTIKGVTSGRIRACFDDGRGSCVAGRFTTKACRSAIDLDMLGERHTRHEESGR